MGSELVYTVLYDQNLLLDLGRNQICVIYECSIEAIVWYMMSKFLDILEGEKSLYLPTHWRNGGLVAGNENIFKGGLKYVLQWNLSKPNPE